jgi:hypothetical protein
MDVVCGVCILLFCGVSCALVCRMNNNLLLSAQVFLCVCVCVYPVERVARVVEVFFCSIALLA